MIAIITGKPGNGKTLDAVGIILDELCRENPRHVYTDVPFRLAALKAYLGRHAKQPYTFDTYFHTIPRERLDDFYAMPEGRKLEFDNLKNPVWASYGKPTVFVLDEAHYNWHSRKRRPESEKVFSYLAGHRGPGDDVYFLTQHANQLDVQLRNMADEWWVNVNTAKRRLFGFRGIEGAFIRNVYFAEPSPAKKPAEIMPWRLDKEKAEVYDTSAKLGTAIGAADTKTKKKGKSPMWAVVGLVGLAAVVALMFWIGPRIALHMLSRKEKKPTPVEGPRIRRGVANEVQQTNGGTNANEKIQSGTNEPAAKDEQIRTKETTENEHGPKSWTGQTGRTLQQGVVANPDAYDSGRRAVRLTMWDGTSKIIYIQTLTPNQQQITERERYEREQYGIDPDSGMEQETGGTIQPRPITRRGFENRGR